MDEPKKTIVDPMPAADRSGSITKATAEPKVVECKQTEQSRGRRHKLTK